MSAREMNEHRYNPATGAWAIYVPGRGHRPMEAEISATPVRRSGPCPFCPGNERLLPEILEETPGPGAAGWATRVVPNKYPGVRPDLTGRPRAKGPYRRAPARGHHEVIIEGPGHDRPLARMTKKELEAVVATYHRRSARLRALEPGLVPILFRNHGPTSGASLGHPHAQIIAVEGLPPGLERRRDAARRYFEGAGRCAVCAMADFERRDGRRVIFETRSFLAFVPFAAAGPAEVWLVPRRHRAAFEDITAAERADLAAALGRAARCLARAFADPDHNLFICSPGGGEEAPWLHWWLEIRPRLTVWGGYELASQVTVVPSRPEADARHLRAALDGAR